MIKNPPIIKKVVKEMGGTIEEIIPERGYFYMNIRGKKILVSRKFKISSSSLIGGEKTKFKDLTYILLKDEKLPTPNTVCFYRKTFDEKNIADKIRALKFPIIIKNAEGSNSNGIFPNIQDLPSAQKIIRKEIRNYSCLIVQEMVSGKEYRLLILKNKLIGALELIPPRVFGNGKDSVKKLIKEKQKQTRGKTAFDKALNQILKEQSFSLKSVPKKGEIVYIRKNSSLAEGGETRDVTDIVNKSAKNIGIKAAQAVEKYLVGIDVICDDIAKDPKKQGFNIIEINGKPDIYIHYNPNHGDTRDVVRDIIEFILKMKEF